MPFGTQLLTSCLDFLRVKNNPVNDFPRRKWVRPLVTRLTRWLRLSLFSENVVFFFFGSGWVGWGSIFTTQTYPLPPQSHCLPLRLLNLSGCVWVSVADTFWVPARGTLGLGKSCPTTVTNLPRHAWTPAAIRFPSTFTKRGCRKGSWGQRIASGRTEPSSGPFCPGFSVWNLFGHLILRQRLSFSLCSSLVWV